MSENNNEILGSTKGEPKISDVSSNKHRNVFENMDAVERHIPDTGPPTTAKTSSSTTSSSSSDPSGSWSSDQDVKRNESCPLNDLLKKNDHCDKPTSQTSKTTGNTPGELTTNDCCDTESRITQNDDDIPICYNSILDDEIRGRLDKLNALSDLINSLELKFDHANALFRETLKCSTERLSAIAKTLGSKSIRQGRIYHAAKITVEQTQSDCQRACVQFERANNDHQSAKEAIKEAELKLREVNKKPENGAHHLTTATSIECIDLHNLKLNHNLQPNCKKETEIECDNHTNDSASATDLSASTISGAISTNKHCGKHSESLPNDNSDTTCKSVTVIPDEQIAQSKNGDEDANYHAKKLINSAKLSEDLNKAITRLIDAEHKRRQSEKLHLDQANKLMIAQENLTKLEREHGTSIRRAQVYFDEAKRFNSKLNSVKSDIARISEEILAAKQAYARTLSELEQFSEDLHINSKNSMNSGDGGS